MTAASVTHALNTAIMLGAVGLPCFPCKLSKRPACTHGFHDAETGPTALRGLWDRFPGELIGVATGEASGFDVLDVDPRHDEALEWCKANQERFPNTRTHKTRSGGVHLLFRHAHGLRCSASRIARGIDVRANGGYAIWWPATGLPVLRAAPLADWPQWLLDQLISPAPARSSVARITVPDSYALAQLVRLVASSHEGERNALTFWAACRAGEMVASGLLDPGTAIAIIAEAGICAGLTRVEAERTARSGVRKTGGGTGV
jgi:Bifunctional DNA primase/polymerase, N-terminal